MKKNTWYLVFVRRVVLFREEALGYVFVKPERTSFKRGLMDVGCRVIALE